VPRSAFCAQVLRSAISTATIQCIHLMAITHQAMQCVARLAVAALCAGPPFSGASVLTVLSMCMRSAFSAAVLKDPPSRALVCSASFPCAQELRSAFSAAVLKQSIHMKAIAHETSKVSIGRLAVADLCTEHQ
jgi:hypothetical protein